MVFWTNRGVTYYLGPVTGFFGGTYTEGVYSGGFSWFMCDVIVVCPD